jgi:hypothetical protein
VIYRGTATGVESEEGADGKTERYRYHYAVIRGCVRAHGRPRTLGTPYESYGSPVGGGSSGIQSLRLAGDVAAFEESFGSVPGILEPDVTGHLEWVVVVINLRSGEVIRKVPTGTTAPASKLTFVGLGPVTALVVKRDGAVAWIVENYEEPGDYEVHALDATGERVLATGADIAPSALVLSGSTLYWTQGGKRLSASLN